MHTRTISEVMMDASLGTTELGHIYMLYQSAPSRNYCLEVHALLTTSKKKLALVSYYKTGVYKLFKTLGATCEFSTPNGWHEQFLYRGPTNIVSHDSPSRHLGDAASEAVQSCNKISGFSIETATAYTTGNIVLLGQCHKYFCTRA